MPAPTRSLATATRVENVACAVLWAVFSRAYLLPGRYVTAFDTVTYSAPNQRVTLDALTNGRIAWWNDRIFGGVAHLGNAQAGALYLPKLLVAPINLHRGMGLLVALHLALAMVGSVMLARRLGARPPAALVAAAVAGGSGAMLTRSTQFEQIVVVAWAPLLFVAVHAVCTSERQWRAASGLALAAAAAVLAGHPQMTYMIGSMTAVFALGVLLATRAWRRLIPLAAAGCVAGCLSALQLLATRAALGLTDLAGGRGLDELKAPGLSVEPGRLHGVLLGTIRHLEPDAFAGGFEGIGYVGVAAACLAVVGFVGHVSSRRHRPIVVGLGVIVVLGSVLALGPRTWLFEVLYQHLPGFDLIRGSARWMTAVDLALAPLAALGVERLARHRSRCDLVALAASVAVVVVLAASTDERAVAFGWLAVAIALAVVAILATASATRASGAATSHRVGADPTRTDLPGADGDPIEAGVAGPAAFATGLPGGDRAGVDLAGTDAIRADLIAAGDTLGHGPPRRFARLATGVRRLPVVALALLPVAELGIASRWSLPQRLTAPVAVTGYESKVTTFLASQPGWSLSFTNDEFNRPGYLAAGLRPNANAIFGARSIDGYDGGVQITRRWINLVGRFSPAPNGLTLRAQITWPLSTEAAASIGVRWLVADRGKLPTERPGWVGPVVSDGQFDVYENPKWIGEAVVSVAGSEPLGAAVRHQSPENFSLRTETTAPAKVTVMSQFDDGWRATIDGSPVSPIEVADFYLGVEVPAGAHTVEFAYRPTWRIPGFVLTAVGILGLLGMAALDRLARRRSA